SEEQALSFCRPTEDGMQYVVTASAEENPNTPGTKVILSSNQLVKMEKLMEPTTGAALFAQYQQRLQMETDIALALAEAKTRTAFRAWAREIFNTKALECTKF